uniref:Uncharacterized protein n=1 Tax=Arundo donax TaxID=35708 RepID=A0A0A9EUC6_ARUDO
MPARAKRGRCSAAA